MSATLGSDEELLESKPTSETSTLAGGSESALQRQRLLEAIEEFGRFADANPNIEYDDLSFRMSEQAD